MEKVAIYGWAFNPPTLWHQTVMTKMLSQKKVDKIIFTPDGDRLDKDYWVSKNLRIKMLENFYESILIDSRQEKELKRIFPNAFKLFDELFRRYIYENKWTKRIPTRHR